MRRVWLTVACSIWLIACGPAANTPVASFPSSSSSPSPSTTARAAIGTVTEFRLPDGSGDPERITTGPDGNLWFTENASNIVAKVTPSGSVTEYAIPTPDSRPTAITAGPDGNLWFIEQTGLKVAKLTTTGAFTEYVVPTPGCPDHIAVGPDGNLWVTVACASNSVLKVTTSGTFTKYIVPTASSWPGGITAGPDGNLWFTEQNANKVARVTTSGIFTEYTLPSPAGSPTDITAGPDGNLWFTELGGNRVAKITTSGSVTEYTLPTPGWPYGGGSIPPGNAPTAITAGPDGNLWFTEQFSNKVASVTTSGRFTEYAIPSGIPMSQSMPATSCPHGITAGPDGNLWFTEPCTHKVAKVVALRA